jgi:hypothetical protein
MKTYALLAFGAALALGCAPPEEEPMPDALNAEACEHAADGPFNDVTASADGSAAPFVSDAHTAHRIATVEIDPEGNRGGTVAFESTMATLHTFWLSAHVDLAFENSSEVEVPLASSVHEVAECDEIAMFHTVELGVGTFTIDVGPTQEESVTVLWEHGEPGAMHDDDHEEM